jgi:uncharacterized membrane protein YkoI
MKMKIQIISLLILFCLSATDAIAQKKSVKPGETAEYTNIVVSGNNHKYYYLNSEKDESLKIDGPSELRIITRAIFKNKEQKKLNYSVLCIIDDNKPKKISFKDVKRSTEALFEDRKLGEPGSLQDFTIILKKGIHKISIKSLTPKVDILAKFVTKHIKKKDTKTWVPYETISKHEEVDIVINEEIVHYDRFTKDNPLKVKVNGPTMLKVFTRVENNDDMQGRVNYRVQVRQNGEVVNTYQISTIRSDVALYKNDEKLVPGKAQEITIEVPKGKHIYEIYPIDENTRSLLGRLFIPTDDIKLEE